MMRRILRRADKANSSPPKEDWPLCDIPGCGKPAGDVIHCDACNCALGSSYGCPVHDPENAPLDPDDLKPWEEATWD
jgi:hypothetical protein